MAMQSAIQAERLSSTEILSLHSHVINEQTCDTVNARDLHTFLEVGRDFSNWIKNRVKQYQFVEGEDFILISLNDQSGFSPKWAKTLNTGGRPTKDYFITLDMAKELAMVERNEKGREARRYFINCERQLKATNSHSPAIESPAIDPTQHSQANEATRTMANLLEGNILALANKRSKHHMSVERAKIGEEVNNYLGVRKLDEATPAQLEQGLIFIQTALEGEYLGRANNPTNEYVASMERRIGFYEYNMKLIHSHTTAMKKDFEDAIFPTLKTTNPRLYGIARERLHIAHMNSKVY